MQPLVIRTDGTRANSSGMQPDAGNRTPFGPPLVQGFSLRSVEGGTDWLLSVRETARRLGVSTATVYDLVERGEIAHVRVSNAIRIAPSDLADFIASRRLKRA